LIFAYLANHKQILTFTSIRRTSIFNVILKKENLKSMKNMFLRSKLFGLLFIGLINLMLVSCSKDTDDKPSYPIAGLWIGTYTYLTQPPLYFSFTIYPDGSMSYKSKGSNDFTFYANGTWTLNGSNFSYSVQTTNTPNVAVQPRQTGTATYSNTGTLTNGVNTDVATGASGTFTMTRVN
jgi:hypothetical protein